MKRQRHSPKQIIRKLRTAEQMLSEDKTAGEAAKALEVSEQTLHRWRNQYGGMKADDAKRLKELERRTASSSRSWPTRRSTSAPTRRSPRETSEPVPEAPSGLHAHRGRP